MKSLKNEVEDYPEGFDGIFRFTNATDEDFVTLWNNKEYTYPAGKTVPMIIANSTQEEVQQIRKYFAKRLAEREFFKTKDFKNMRNGIKDKDAGHHVVPSMFNESLLQPWIDECLKPLAEGRASVTNLPSQDLPIKASKALGSGNKDNPYPAADLNEEFKDSNAELLANRG